MAENVDQNVGFSHDAVAIVTSVRNLESLVGESTFSALLAPVEDAEIPKSFGFHLETK